MAARRPHPAPSSRRPQQPVRRGATRPPARRRRGRRVLAWLGGLFAVGVVLGLAGFATAYALVDVPDPNELADAQTSTVYYSDGTTPIGTFSEVNRQDVDIEQVPEVVQHAVLAAEDRSFYENRGVSPSGIARALWSNISDGTQQGGSTITQQYVKNYYLSSEQTYTRKLKEFFIALKIDQQQSKAETLEDYLNTVYFGRGAYGIQAAAQEYFGVDVEQLNASQGALLAAVLKAPRNYDPRNDAEAAAQRVDYVLDGMVEEGWLSAEERAQAGLPETVEDTDDNELAGPEGYLLDTVKRELTSSTVGLTEEEVERGGLSIVTTFDAQAQAAAVEAVQDRLPEDLPEGFHVALSAIDPATGGVVAMYGGADYLERQRNAVTQDTAQAGSTFKPFTLVAALEEGTSLRTTLSGASPMTVDGWTVKNFGGSSYGRINLLTATANSVNTVYAQLNEEVGPEATRDVAIRAGYPQDTAGLADEDTTISNVLGTASPHPIDVTQAYATFAAQGVRTDWHTIVSVTDADGTRTYTASPAQERVFSEDVIADATYAMQQVVQQGSGRYARNLGRPAAGKTGTSSSNKSAWFAGYTPQLAASVALYQSGPDGEAQSLDLGGGEVTGGSYPVRIWTDFMEDALEGTEELDFPEPAYVGSSRGPSSSSSRESSSSSSTSTRTSTPTATATESATSTATASPTDGDSPTSSPSATSSATATSRPSGTATATSRPSASARPTATATGGGEDEEEAASTGTAEVEAERTARSAAPSAAGADG
ncbi:transglycosylase domain-containing protein [Kineococcus sp. G2]|uniref:transglycosylase domain-containing protein n=1 Tax=Kineococcus sp. G2 TaxID=3127484 RepID=UPI00301D95AC